jgi:hypothetical protein
MGNKKGKKSEGKGKKGGGEMLERGRGLGDDPCIKEKDETEEIWGGGVKWGARELEGVREGRVRYEAMEEKRRKKKQEKDRGVFWKREEWWVEVAPREWEEANG